MTIALLFCAFRPAKRTVYEMKRTVDMKCKHKDTKYAMIIGIEKEG